MKEQYFQRAIKLRRQGLSYRDILVKIPVAKSTLSLWLRSVGLSREQKQRLTQRRVEASQRGGRQRKEQRIARTKVIYKEAGKLLGRVSERDLFIAGIALYWAEGSKQKEHAITQRVSFSNSDPAMVKTFIIWLQKCLSVNISRIQPSLYVHTSHRHRLMEIRQYWALHTGLPASAFASTYFKRHNPRTVRKRVGENYFGLVRIEVRESTDLNRKIAGLILAATKYWGVV